MNNLRQHNSKSFTQGKKKAKSNQVNGNSIEQFVILPARSRVSVSCLGEIGEGFLNIKRL